MYTAEDIPHKSTVVETLGYLMKDNEEGVSVAGERFPETADVRNYTFIPRGMIISVSEIAPKTKRPRKVAQPLVEPLKTLLQDQ